MSQDAADDAGICNKGDDAHAAAARAPQRVRLEDFLNQPSPCAAGLPGGIRIVGLGKRTGRKAGAICICRRRRNPAAVGINPIESLAMPPRVRNMRRHAVNPFRRIQFDGSRACPGIGGRFHNQAAVAGLSQRIHSQHRPGDISGLRFNGSDCGGIDRRTGIHGKSRMDPCQKILHETFG